MRDEGINAGHRGDGRDNRTDPSTIQEQSTSIHVVLLDDHPLVMEGLKNRLEQEPGIHVLRTYAHPQSLLDEIGKLRADVIILDISLPQMDGFEVAGRLKKQFGQSIKIIMLSGYMYDEFVHKAFDLGVHAYLSKQSTYSQIINAVKQSMLGHVLIPEHALTAAKQEQLTPMEREVLKQVAQERTNKEIAQVLAISQRTVEYHLTSITQKLGVRSRIGAVAKGYELGLLTRMSSADESEFR
ncbi:response regulator [Paenibacillus sp. J22TS3]|uniref:response regulator transcription factor n=1 Tax=Paenibacillus sp. J22TS3 TaxID=2807192 RepID=UPI001B15884C|nr:response regulator transcription factor [Paenibacillus sp. J22TS3]GIP21723.1 DNA-binding response regulator [Paenibacillus sp. J22TS3]